MQAKTAGMILKQRNIGENDRILTVLSQDMGLIEVCARRSKSPKNPLTAATQVLCYSSFELYKGKASYYIADSAEIIRPFYDLRLDVVKVALASYFAELCAAVSPTVETSDEILRMLLNTMHLLETERYTIGHLRPIFELRVLSLSGFMPNLVACEECAAYEAEPMYFIPADGLLCCSECFPKSSLNREDTLAIALPLSVLSAMRHIVFSDSKKVFSFKLASKAATLLYDTVQTYVSYHIDTNFKSLHIFESMFDRGSI